MTELYQQLDAVLQKAKLHMYYHFDHKCLVIVPFTDQVYNISDQWTVDEWAKYINERSGVNMFFRVYHNPMTKEYVVVQDVFGSQFTPPKGFWMMDIGPTPLVTAIGDVVIRIGFAKQPVEVSRTETAPAPGETVYTETQVITLVRMIRGDLNNPESDELIHRLLNVIK